MISAFEAEMGKTRFRPELTLQNGGGNACTDIGFVDSARIPVVHNKREFNMEVPKGIAAKGKGAMGWYVGFKPHLLCNG